MKNFTKKIGFLIAGFIVLMAGNAYSQSCSTTTNNTNYLFFTGCQTGSSYTLTGNYSITVNNNSILKINGDVTINGTLTINMVGADSKIEILSPYTLTATNIVFSGSATGKNLIVDGPSGKVVVSGTLNFGGMTIDLDGNGSISAGSITGADNISCSSDGSCPSTSASSCSPANSTLCSLDLPIQLIDFSAKKSPNGVLLSWATASELNFDYFSVQHSANGKDFSEIAQVKGHGTTKEKNEYSHEDSRPLIGKNYYRLSSVDFDGYTEDFNVVGVDYSGEKSFDVTPNPSQGKKISLIFNFPLEEGATVTVYDNLGGWVGTFKIQNDNIITFQNPLKSGVYYAKITSDDFSKVARFLVNE